MKKKLFSVLLAVAVMATLFAGCGTKEEGGSGNEGGDEQKTIAFSWSYTSSDFFQALSGFLQGMYEEQGYKVEVATAEGDANLQTQQIENFVTMKVDAIVVVPVDNTGLADACQKAVDEGIPVIGFTSDISSATTNLLSADETKTGEECVRLATEWMDTVYADAADGSVEAAVLVYSGDEKGVQRSDAMVDTLKKDPRINLVKVVESQSTNNEAGQTAAENLFTTNPNLKVIMAYNSAMANGVNSYVMSANSGIEDKSGIGVFSTDESDEVKANILASVNDEAVVRGIVSLGGFGDIFSDLNGVLQKVLAGESVDRVVVGKLIPITAENVADYITE